MKRKIVPGWLAFQGLQIQTWWPQLYQSRAPNSTIIGLGNHRTVLV